MRSATPLFRFRLERGFIPYESMRAPDGAIESYFEGFTKTWACDILLLYSYGREAFYLTSASFFLRSGEGGLRAWLWPGRGEASVWEMPAPA